MIATLDTFLEKTGAVLPNYNPNYVPSNPILNELGLVPGKNAVLSIEDGKLVVEATDTQANFELETSADPGSLSLSVHFTSTARGRIDLRWAEQDVKPEYFKSRLTRSDNYPESQDAMVELPFEAGATVTSFRIDFMQPAGTIQIEKIELKRNGAAEKTWLFND